MEESKSAQIWMDSPVGYADGTWQIGSKAPPKVCLCCGEAFDDAERRIHGPYSDGPYRYICDWCWRKPFNFLPDKVRADCGECWVDPMDGSFQHVHKLSRYVPTTRSKRSHDQAP